MTLYLVKDSNDLVSWCECERALATLPGQMDCPWCGCGWLFTCITCRKAFTFARAVEVPEALREIAELDVRGFWGEASEARVAEWLDVAIDYLAEVQVGKRYVYLDGHWLDIDEFPLDINGWYGRHQFDEAPQVTALRDPSILDHLLQDPTYWRAHAYSETAP